jgi:D-glycero-D-manno-heptose 1,7-bisphosphate phosphatase
MGETVFLDRDGVINRKAEEGSYITRWPEFQLLPGATCAIARLTHAGIRTIVLTNQRAVARGLMTKQELAEIHARMVETLAKQGARIDAVFACEHDVETCDCRKPAAGLFLRARREIPAIDFACSTIIGDSASDLEPGHALGCRLVLVGDTSRRAQQLNRLRARGVAVHFSAASLGEAVDLILAEPLTTQ